MAAHTFPAIKLSSTKVALSTLPEDLSSSSNGLLADVQRYSTWGFSCPGGAWYRAPDGANNSSCIHWEGKGGYMVRYMVRREEKEVEP